MSELITTLGAGVLAAPYVSGSGTMTVTPATWPDGLSFPPSGVFSISLKTGTGPKYPVYTVSAVATAGGNRVFTVALEAGADTSAAAAAVVSEVVTARSLAALIAAGGGGGATYKYQYFSAGNSTNFANGLVAMNGPNPSGGTGLNGPTGGFTATGIMQFAAGGSAQTMFPVRLPDTWDGSAITLDLDLAFASSPGSGLFQAYSICPAIDSDPDGPFVWTAGTAVAVVSAGLGPPAIAKCRLQVPLTGLTAGSMIFLGIARPADAFSGIIVLFGANLGVKY